MRLELLLDGDGGGAGRLAQALAEGLLFLAAQREDEPEGEQQERHEGGQDGEDELAADAAARRGRGSPPSAARVSHGASRGSRAADAVARATRPEATAARPITDEAGAPPAS